MNSTQNAILVLVLSSAAGCGQQLVEFLDLSAGSDMAAGAGDLAGHDLAVADMSTAGNGDGGQSTAPRVIATNPAGGATNLCIPFQIDATFDKQMDPLTTIAANFTQTGPGTTPVKGTVSYDDRTRTASFLPSSSLSATTTYTATVTTGVKDAAGDALAANRVWSFMNNANPCTLPVNLRSLATFVAVAGAGLTNSNSMGITVLNGDVGLSPTATCLGDGSPCSAIDPTINGTLYANDPAGKATTAKADFVSAYNDAQGRPPGGGWESIDECEALALTRWLGLSRFLVEGPELAGGLTSMRADAPRLRSSEVPCPSGERRQHE